MNINQLLGIQNRQLKKDWNNEKFNTISWNTNYYKTIRNTFDKLQKNREWIYVYNKGRNIIIEFSNRLESILEEKFEFIIKTKDTKKGYFKDLRVYKIEFKNKEDKEKFGNLSPEELIDILRKKYNKRLEEYKNNQNGKIENLKEEFNKFGLTMKDFKRIEKLINSINTYKYNIDNL